MRILVLLFIFFVSPAFSQLKFVVEDFEGFSIGKNDLRTNGVFTFGSCATEAVSNSAGGAYAGQTALQVNANSKMKFGGFGKGVGLNVNLDVAQDHLNFYILSPGHIEFSIELQEDEDENNVYKKEVDESWIYNCKITGNSGWQLISVPLSAFKDNNSGGDGKLNIGYNTGKLFTVIYAFSENTLKQNPKLLFDFICFSKGSIKHNANPFDPQIATREQCSLGAWSMEGNSANFSDIAHNFEKTFGSGTKRLAVVHFFQSFSVNGGGAHLYPSVERINKVIDEGYIPMITLEDHFVNSDPNVEQPNLYSIVEGHFDSFLGYWTSQIKQVKGPVLLRMLHEFNGDWYPWCTVNNNKDPYLVGKAFRYIVNVFRQNNVTNVKFIWCPNSMSVPQEKWNDIQIAYPGDDYVDLVGLDVYNGAGTGNSQIWRSFRKEGMENYFVLTEKYPSKPLLICEVASRERSAGEAGQSKADWISQMSEAVGTDMNKIKLIAWFNEKQTFKVNSSAGSQKAFLDKIISNKLYSAGKETLQHQLKLK